MCYENLVNPCPCSSRLCPCPASGVFCPYDIRDFIGTKSLLEMAQMVADLSGLLRLFVGNGFFYSSNGYFRLVLNLYFCGKKEKKFFFF
jgi:hypothetical protein